MRSILRKILKGAAIAVLAVGCTGNFEEVNTNPNIITKPTMTSILMQAQQTIAKKFLDDNDVLALERWVQYHGTTGYSEQAYDYDWNTDQVENYVWDVLKNLKFLEEFAIEDGHSNFEAIAKIMNAWIYLNTVELYGDMPYFDALKATEGILYPKFDPQVAIMKEAIKELTAAIELIDHTLPVIPATSELYCKGDMYLWEKFANSLKARTLLNLSNVDEAYAKAGLEELFLNPDKYPLLSSNSDNIGIEYLSPDGGSYNYTSTFVTQRVRDGYRRYASTFIVDLVCSNNDPRRVIFFNPTLNSIEAVEEDKTSDEYIYRGCPPVVMGKMESYDTKDLSDIGDPLAADFSRPIDIQTYAEICFIRAEAAAKGYNVGVSAQDAYEAGIKASMDKWGVEDQAKIETYLASEFVTFNSAKALEQIVTQRYIDAYHQSVQAFTLIRRSGELEIAWNRVGYAIDNGFPDRFPYSHNLRNGHPDFNEVTKDLVSNIWGNTEMNVGVDVSNKPNYVKPIEYKFKDR